MGLSIFRYQRWYVSPNPRSYRPKMRVYRYFRADVWGRVGYANKINNLTNTLSDYTKYELNESLKFIRKRKKKKLRRSLGLFHRYKIMNPFTLKKLYKYTKIKKLNTYSRIKMLYKRLKAFYFFKLKRKPARKFFRSKVLKPQAKNNPYEIPTFMAGHNNSGRWRATIFPAKTKAVVIEGRHDVILYRLNFASNLLVARKLITNKHAFIMRPCGRKKKYRKFFEFYRLRKYYFKLPLFHFTTLRYDLCLKLKLLLEIKIRSKKILSYPPSYLMMDHITMVALRHRNPDNLNIRYPFSGTLGMFLSTLRYC